MSWPLIYVKTVYLFQYFFLTKNWVVCQQLCQVLKLFNIFRCKHQEMEVEILIHHLIFIFFISNPFSPQCIAKKKKNRTIYFMVLVSLKHVKNCLIVFRWGTALYKASLVLDHTRQKNFSQLEFSQMMTYDHCLTKPWVYMKSNIQDVYLLRFKVMLACLKDYRSLLVGLGTPL